VWCVCVWSSSLDAEEALAHWGLLLRGNKVDHEIGEVRSAIVSNCAWLR
jgi:hypothetical protein